MGPDYCCVFAHLAACAPFRPPKIPPNSFAKTNLPLTLTRRRTYAQIPPISMKTRNFVGRGEGVSLAGGDGRDTCHRSCVADGGLTPPRRPSPSSFPRAA